MPAPSVRSTATPTVNSTGGVASVTVPVPSGGVAGDLYQITVSLQWFSAGVIPATPNATGSGFDQVVTDGIVTGSRANRLAVFGRKHDGSEGATFTVAGIDTAVTYIVVTCQAIQDADTSGSIAAALDGTAATNKTTGGGASSLALGSVTTTVADAAAFSVIACYSNPVASDPSTWTQVDSADGGFIEVYRKAMAAAGATGTDTIGLTAEEAGVCATWAWKPAPAVTVPAAIDDLAGTAGDEEVVLTWTAPDDGGATITDYVVQYREAATTP